MRTAMLLLATAVGCACPGGKVAETGTRYITIGSDAVVTAQFVASHDGTPAEILADNGDVAILAVDATELDALSHEMHEQHERCGGFMLHDSLADARDAMQPPIEAMAPIDYKLDRAEAVNATLPALDKARILDTIGQLSAMKNRYYRSETGAAASTWLQARWRGFTARTDVTVELFDHGYPQKSVILTIPGTTRASEVVVIGGHLDSIARGGNAAVAPGADDDASGISTLDEVLRVLLAKDYRPERTVKFMAYAAEEVGLRGSLAIAKAYKQSGVDVVGALQLDMTNFQGSDKDIWLITDHTNGDQNAFVTKLIETYTGATYGTDRCGYACSDHASWHRYGFRASMPFESRFRDSNRDIHTARDTLERSDNNAEHAIKFARLAASYAIELGKGELGAPAATPDVMIATREPASSCRCGGAGSDSTIPSWLLGLGALGALGALAALTRLFAAREI